MIKESTLLIFCRNVKWLREYYCLSKEKMAKIMGISVACLHQIEAGQLPATVLVDSVFELASYFHLKSCDLLLPLQDKSPFFT